MLKNMFFLLSALGLLAGLSSCHPSPEEIVQYYGTGEVARRHTEINGKKEGKMTEFYRDGSLKGERMFENDIQVGKSTFYYPSGAVKEVQYYQDGKMHGGDTLFYESGRPQFLRTFDAGVLNGYIRKWAEDGSVIYEARYSHDTLVEVKGESVDSDSILIRAK